MESAESTEYNNITYSKGYVDVNLRTGGNINILCLRMRMGKSINCVAVLSLWKLDKNISTFASSCFIFSLASCKPTIFFGVATKFRWYKYDIYECYDMAIFLHKLPSEKCHKVFDCGNALLWEFSYSSFVFLSAFVLCIVL